MEPRIDYIQEKNQELNRLDSLIMLWENEIEKKGGVEFMNDLKKLQEMEERARTCLSAFEDGEESDEEQLNIKVEYAFALLRQKLEYIASRYFSS